MTRLNDAMDIVCYVRWLSFHDNFIYHMNVWLQMFSPNACNEACLDWWQCVKYFWSQIPGLLKIEKRERVTFISPTLEDHHSGEAVKKAKIKLVQWRMSLGNDNTLWAELFRSWEKGKFTKMITSPLIFWNLLYFRWQIFAAEIWSVSFSKNTKFSLLAWERVEWLVYFQRAQIFLHIQSIKKSRKLDFSN